MAQHDFQSAFTFARGIVASSSTSNSGPSLPWEKGPFASIFQDDQPTSLNEVALSEVPIPENPHVQSYPTSIDDLDESFTDAKRFFLLQSSPTLQDILPSADTFDSKQEGLRHLAIARLINIVGSFDTCGLSQACDSIWELQQSFHSALAMRSTNTLIKRSLSLKRYSDWCDSQGIHVLPFQERAIFKYLSIVAAQSAPSGPLSILQAINFAIHVLSCKVAFPHATTFPSQRIRGLCYGHQASGDVVQHAKPLAVAQISHLETLCATTDDPYFALIFGTMLITLYARARWHDIQAAQSIQFDPDTRAPEFIELPSRRFKTANILARRTEFLPITAVCFSISQQPWLAAYIRARQHFSLPISGRLFTPLLPQRLHNELASYELSSSVITKLLRRIFRDDTLRTHSLKHTLLSFAAKRGLSPHDRKLLGYHLDKEEVSLATYSRDMLSEPLRKLSVLLLEIQHGVFQPDNTRSGYLQNQTSLDSATYPNSLTNTPDFSKSFENQHQQFADFPVSEDHDSDLHPFDDSPPESTPVHSDSDSDNSSDISISDGEEASAIPPPPEKFADESCYDPNLIERFSAIQHCQSHRLHLIQDASHSRMLCGRAVSSTYIRLADWPQIPFPICSQCFSSKAVGAFDEDIQWGQKTSQQLRCNHCLFSIFFCGNFLLSCSHLF